MSDPMPSIKLGPYAKAIVGGILAAVSAAVTTTLTITGDGAVNADEIGVLITAWGTVAAVVIGVYAKRNALAPQPASVPGDVSAGSPAPSPPGAPSESLTEPYSGRFSGQEGEPAMSERTDPPEPEPEPEPPVEGDPADPGPGPSAEPVEGDPNDPGQGPPAG